MSGEALILMLGVAVLVAVVLARVARPARDTAPPPAADRAPVRVAAEPVVTPAAPPATPAPPLTPAMPVALSELLGHPWDALLVVDRAGRVRNHRLQALGIAEGEGVERRLDDLLHDDDVAAARTALAEMARDGDARREVRWRLRTEEGGWMSSPTVLLNLLDDPAVEGVVVAARHDGLVAGPPAAEDADRDDAVTTILVVDDHDANRALMGRILGRAGHRVVEAPDPAAAAERFADDTDRPDLLLTDVVLPGGSGGELAARLRADVPHLPVVFVSGYGALLDRYGVGDEPVLSKPFRPDELLNAVEAALAAARPSVPASHGAHPA